MTMPATQNVFNNANLANGNRLQVFGCFNIDNRQSNEKTYEEMVLEVIPLCKVPDHINTLRVQTDTLKSVYENLWRKWYDGGKSDETLDALKSEYCVKWKESEDKYSEELSAFLVEKDAFYVDGTFRNSDKVWITKDDLEEMMERIKKLHPTANIRKETLRATMYRLINKGRVQTYAQLLYRTF